MITNSNLIRPISVATWCFAAILVAWPTITFGQNVDEAVQLRAGAFGEWVEARLREIGPADGSPEPVLDAVVRRLESDRITPRPAITASLSAMWHHESRMERQDFMLTRHYAEKLIPLLEHDVIVRAAVRLRYGDVWARMERRDPAYQQYAAAADELAAERVELLKPFGSANVKAGYQRLAARDTDGADEWFRQALTVPWWLTSIATSDRHYLFHDQYRAATGRIAANQYDLEALQALRFRPAVSLRVEDQLNAAIEAAKQRSGGADLENR
jgi:hypothetical protein